MNFWSAFATAWSPFPILAWSPCCDPSKRELCKTEAFQSVGVLNPSDARTPIVIDTIGRQIKAMAPHRIFAPDVGVLGRAALLSGILCRLQGYEKDAELRVLQDCVLFLQAQKLGLVVLTANVSDFDILLQLIPTGRTLFYRRK